MMLHRRTIMVLVVVAAGLVVGAGVRVAWASIPDSSGVIHGCYKNDTGVLRVVDTGAGGACNTKSETSLDWSQTGVQGVPGVQGAPGSQGSPGPAGPNGVASYQLVTGTGTTSGGNVLVNATCPSGTTATGGGFDLPPSTNVSVFQSLPDGSSWSVWVFGDNGVTVTAYAVCVNQSQFSGE